MNVDQIMVELDRNGTLDYSDAAISIAYAEKD